MINQFRKGNKNIHNKTRKQQKTTFLIKKGLLSGEPEGWPDWQW